jgi:hypothetical protein
MLEHGWPQNFVVSGLRSIRRDLTRRHEAILVKPVSQRSTEPGQPGELEIAYPASDFLLVVSDSGSGKNVASTPYLRLFDNQSQAFAFQMQKVGRSCSWFALEGPARELNHHLLHTLPKHRGRGS